MLERTKGIVGETLIKQGLNYLARDPEQNLDRLIDWAARIATDPAHKEQIAGVAKYLREDTNWRKYAIGVLKETHPNVLQRTIVGFLVNSTWLGVPRQKEAARRLGVSVPWALLIDPTEKCNLRCLGCWAGDYQRARDLELPLLKRIVGEAEELGIHFIVVSGGEPTVRMDDLLQLARAYPGTVFHVFTNGTLLTDEVIDKVCQAGNINFAISLEGLAESTDQRRGQGTFAKVMGTMDRLRRAGALFGFSATYTRHNTEEIASDTFIDLMIEKGCRFGWLFTYIPVGADADRSLMATPEQRGFMARRVEEIRSTKPLFLADFWNDGRYTGGCIAGGKRYLHINAAGDIEPCAFVHYATGNIRDMSLAEALKSPLMRAYQKRQPFNSNHLRPCPLIDNPEQLAAIVAESNARSTQESNVDAGALAESLKEYAAAWGVVAERLEEERAHRKNTAN